VKHIATALFFCTFLAAQSKSPERTFQANVITSERDPKVRIELPKSVQYVGADRWVLYGMADCELHAFVEVDAEKNVRRLYWVQFEGYLPTRPELKHTYDSPRIAKLGGMEFYIDTWVRPDNAATRLGSDLEHIQALIRAHGYKLPAGMMSVRLVHLLDNQKRKELMIIYSEDVAPTGFTAAELLPGGTARDRWPAIEKSLVERAQSLLILQFGL
jgi:hypothetical protein